MESSRAKAEAAQLREFQTFQPKESLSTLTKARITITNFLGGKYFFTVDETKIEGERLYLIESKHSKNSKLPSIGDIKDGLLKIMLYTNLENVSVNGILSKSVSVLRLTSEKLKGSILSTSTKQERLKFFRNNNLNKRQIEFIRWLFVEARRNSFLITLEQVNNDS